MNAPTRPIPVRLRRAVAGAFLAACACASSYADDLLTNQMVEEAKMWQSKGRQDLAADIWRRLLISNPQNGVALVGLAQTQTKSGNLSEAEALLARAARLPRKPAGLEAASAALANAKTRAAPPAAPSVATATVAPPPQPAKPALPPVAATKAALTPSANNSAPLQKPSASTTSTPPVRTPAAPVPPPRQEVQVTPIPLRTVDPKSAAADEDPADTLHLRDSSPLSLVSSSAGGAMRSTEPAKPGSKNKPRPCRPAPPLPPPLAER